MRKIMVDADTHTQIHTHHRWLYNTTHVQHVPND